MNVIDIILIVLIAAAVIFALRRTHKNLKNGGCGCGCCDGSCSCGNKKEKTK